MLFEPPHICEMQQPKASTEGFSRELSMEQGPVILPISSGLTPSPAAGYSKTSVDFSGCRVGPLALSEALAIETLTSLERREVLTSSHLFVAVPLPSFPSHFSWCSKDRDTSAEQGKRDEPECAAVAATCEGVCALRSARRLENPGGGLEKMESGGAWSPGHFSISAVRLWSRPQAPGGFWRLPA